MTRLRIVFMVAALVLAAAVAPAAAQQTLGATFSGYAENPTLNSPGSGTFTMTISEDEQSFSYVLTYQGLTAVVSGHKSNSDSWLPSSISSNWEPMSKTAIEMGVFSKSVMLKICRSL